MMMKLFRRWKKSGHEIYAQNSKPILFGNKQSLFDVDWCSFNVCLCLQIFLLDDLNFQLFWETNKD
jgi:hypothetical protein